MILVTPSPGSGPAPDLRSRGHRLSCEPMFQFSFTFLSIIHATKSSQLEVQKVMQRLAPSSHRSFSEFSDYVPYATPCFPPAHCAFKPQITVRWEGVVRKPFRLKVGLDSLPASSSANFCPSYHTSSAIWNKIFVFQTQKKPR